MCYSSSMIHWNLRSYTKEEFIAAWNSSRSIAECLRKIQKQGRGGNYRIANETAKELGLSYDHMDGQGWNKGIMIPRTARPLEEILVEGSKASSSKLRVRLIREKVFIHKCYCCKLTEWNGRPIPLELEHINGIHSDNRIENLTLLCPNCHAQTDTYRGKNQKRAGVGQRRAGTLKMSDEERSIAGSTPATRTCSCGSAMSNRSIRCKRCHNDSRPTKIIWPSDEELRNRLAKSNFTRLAKELGVSDNAIRNRLKSSKPL